MSSAELCTRKRSDEVIVDGGSTATVVGWEAYIDLCYSIGTKPIILPRRDGDPKYHAFGTKKETAQMYRT